MDSWFAWGSRVNCYRPQLFISVSDARDYSPLIRMSRGASNFYDSGVSSQEVWGLMIFVPPSPGLFLLLLMFRNCEGSPRVPACCCLCHPGRCSWGEATAISWEILDQLRDDWNAILSYLLNTALASLCLESLQTSGGSLQYFIRVNIQQTNKGFKAFLIWSAYEGFKTWHKHSIEKPKKVWL